MEKNEKDQIKNAAKIAFLVIAAVAVLALALFSIGSIWDFIAGIISMLTSLIIGLCLAYLLSPILGFFENKVFAKINIKKKRSKLRRMLSLASTYILIIGMLLAFILVIIPNISENIEIFTEKYGSVDKALDSIRVFVDGVPIINNYTEKIMSFIESNIGNAVDFIYKSIIPFFTKYAVSFANTIYSIIIGFVYSIYVLGSKERFTAITKKIMKASFKQKTIDKISLFVGLVDVNFGKYLRGKIIDSIIVGIVSAIVYMIFGLKFYPVLALIAAVTNMIPFFGPFIGAVPAGFIVLIAQPEKLILLFLIILVIQQLDGNILDPMIVGGQVGLIPIFTMTSTILFGGIFGIPGMLLGVPIFASFYTIAAQYIGKKLKGKNLPTSTRDFYKPVKMAQALAEGETPQDNARIDEGETNGGDKNEN